MTDVDARGRAAPRTADEPQVVLRLLALTKQVRAFVAAAFGPLGIHPGQDRLLSELWREDGLSQSQLIERLGVEPPTVTGTVQRLERAGFIRREPDAANRRISRVHLTPAGRQLEEPVRAVLGEAEDRLLHGLSAAERRELAALLARAGIR